MAAEDDAATAAHDLERKDVKVIAASSLGTMFEWYDFYLYGLLAGYISTQFFSGVNETTAFILALAAFAAGFAIRPLGSIVFGRIGDVVGRKYTFLVTMGLMGLSTFAVGFLPNYETIGIAAPIILVTLRLLQGLAVGGEYGGAATYVAEHAPEGRRGFFTSFIPRDVRQMHKTVDITFQANKDTEIGNGLDAAGNAIAFLEVLSEAIPWVLEALLDTQ